jgi:uncharacterized protein YbjT (DUF2867 family)
MPANDLVEFEVKTYAVRVRRRVEVKVIIFGATGMVGQGVLRECLLDAQVDSILSVGRNRLAERNEKLREIMHKSLFDLSAIEGELGGFDACFFCLGVSSVGMTEADYRKVTYGMTLAVAETLVKLNPAMTFVYVSGAGTDSSEQGRTMWARVKGETENALLRLPFKRAYMFRPGVIQPLHGIRSKTRLYQFFYDVLGPLLSLAVKAFPKYVTTTQQIGRAMIRVARDGGEKRVLESEDISKAAES